MSPQNIVNTALAKKLDVIAITDHNSTRQCRAVLAAAAKTPLSVIVGAEVTSKEEVHCLAYFGSLEQMDAFQAYLDTHLPNIKNDVNRFGYQVVVDAYENIVYEEQKLLITAIDQSIDAIAAKVHELGGLFIPAHIDKPKYSLLSQLGFIPADLQADAFELSKYADKETLLKSHKQLQNKVIFQNSDAHLSEDIGKIYNELDMQSPDFDGLKNYIQQQNNA